MSDPTAIVSQKGLPASAVSPEQAQAETVNVQSQTRTTQEEPEVRMSVLSKSLKLHIYSPCLRAAECIFGRTARRRRPHP
jgi:hypothetical protein